MWILPRQFHTSPFVPDTAALISDCDEFSQLCAQSLTARGKDSAARIWSAKLKRDSWMWLLFGRTLRPSHGSSFVDAWTSSLAATRASHSVPPASDSAPKTQDTSGLTYQPELLKCDQVPVSLKMSKDISRWGCPTSSKTWADWVTERRGAWRQRVNAARLTSGKGSSSWPTISVNESKNSVGKSQEHRNSIPLGTMAVMQDAANWRTPTEEALGTGKHMDSADLKLGARVYNKNGKLMAIDLNRQVEIVARQHGPAAPASSSMSGSRQGLSEQFPTPRTCDWKSSPNADSNHKRVNQGLCTLAEFVHSKHKKGDLWSTPRTGATESSRPNNKGGIPLADQAKREQWATPQAKDHKSGHRDPTIVQYKQLNVEVEARATGKLNPRWVETLMGLPIGWTMPSCTSPQTIAPTSYDSSVMESCLPPQSGLFECSLAS